MTTYRTIAGSAAQLRSGEITAVELVEESIANADRTDTEIGVYLRRFDDEARAAAEKTDAALKAGQDPGPLAGIPLGVKDIIATEGAPDHRAEPGARCGMVRGTRRCARGRPSALGRRHHHRQEHHHGVRDRRPPIRTSRSRFPSIPGIRRVGPEVPVPAPAAVSSSAPSSGGDWAPTPAAASGCRPRSVASRGHKPTFGLVPKSGCVPLATASTTSGRWPGRPKTARSC